MIRDTALIGKTPHYIHYSYPNFKSLVDHGLASWEAVAATSYGGKKKNGVVIPPPNAQADLDDYGFPKLLIGAFQGAENEATLADCAHAIKPLPLPLGGRKLGSKVSNQDDGSPTPAKSIQAQREHGDRRPAKARNPGSGRQVGRPRSVAKLGLPSDFDTLSSKEQERILRLKRYAIKYASEKAEKDISLRVEAGMELSQARELVFAETDDLCVRSGEKPISGAIKAYQRRLLSLAGPQEEYATSVDIHTREDSPNQDHIDELALILGTQTYRRPRKNQKMLETPYLPSIAAHTRPAPSLVPMTTKRKRNNKPLDKTVSMEYLPSIAAHTRPVPSPAPATTRKKRAYKRREKKANSELLPLIAAHERPILTPAPVTHRKRNPKPRKESSNQEYVPSVAAHTFPYYEPIKIPSKPSRKRKRDSIVQLGPAKPPKRSKESVVASKPAKQSRQSFYAHLSDYTTRSGVELLSLSEKERNPSRRGQPYGRLAVFKTDRLKNFSWFASETTPPAFAMSRSPTVEVNGEQPLYSNATLALAATPLARCQGFPITHQDPSRNQEISIADPKFVYAAPESRPTPTDVQQQQPHEATNTDAAQSEVLSARSQVATTTPTDTAPRSVRMDTHTIPQLSANNRSAGYMGLPEVDQEQRTARIQQDPQPSHWSQPDATMSPVARAAASPKPDTLESQLLRPEEPSEAASTPIRNESLVFKGPERFVRTTADRVAPDNGQHRISNTQATSISRSEPAPSCTDQLRKSADVRMTAENVSLFTDEVAVSDVDLITYNVGRPGQRKLTRQKKTAGGSLALLRQTIILDLLGRCGGVIPLDKSLELPFAVEWNKRGQPGTPDKETVKKTVDALERVKKIRKKTFAFSNSRGLAVTKLIVLLPDITDRDPRVKDIEEGIRHFDPACYYLESLKVPPVVDRRALSAWTRAIEDDETLVSLQHTQQRLENLEKTHRAKIEKSEQRKRANQDKIIEAHEKGRRKQAEKDVKGWRKLARDLITAGESIREAGLLRAATDNGVGEVGRGNVYSHGQHRRMRDYFIALTALNDAVPTLMPAESPENPNEEGRQPTATGHKHRNAEEFQKAMTQYYEVLAALAPSDVLARLQLPPLLLTSLTTNRLDTLQPRPLWSGLPRQLFVPRTIERLASLVSNPRSTTRAPDPKEAAFTRHLALLRMTEGSLRSVPISQWKTVENEQLEHTNAITVEAVDVPIHTLLNSRPPWEILDLRTVNAESRALRNCIEVVTPPRVYNCFYNEFQNEFVEDVENLLDLERNHIGSDAVGFAEWPFVNHTLDCAHELAGSPVVDLNASVIQDSWPQDRPQDNWRFLNHSIVGAHEVADTPTVDMNPVYQADGTGQHGMMVKRPMFMWHSSEPIPSLDEDSLEMVMWLAEAAALHFHVPPQEETHTRAPISQDSTRGELVIKDKARKVSTKNKTPKEGKVSKPKMQGKPPAAEKIRRKRKAKSSSELSKPVLKKRRLTQAAEKSSVEHELQKAPIRRIFTRGPRKPSRLFGEKNEKRLLVAVIVIRTIAGGLDQMIDWVLVAKVFHPEFDEMFIHSVWPSIRQKHKLQGEKIISDFQELFPRAYEERAVPPLDFDHLEDYPWAKLVDWTVDQIDFSMCSDLELPGTRSELDKLFVLKDACTATMAPFFDPGYLQCTVTKRRAVLTKQAFVCPILAKSDRLSEADESMDFEVVKSYVRANIVTPEATYNAQAAHDRLLEFDKDEVSRAVKELMTTKVLVGQKKNRPIPGRNYDLSKSSIDTLSKNPSAQTLQRAVIFKRYLDRQLRGGRSVKFNNVCKNEHAVVILNLLSHGRIKVRPYNPPRNKWGLLVKNGVVSYEGRQIDKKKLLFAVEIRASDSYVEGNPLLPLPGAPKPHLIPDGNGRGQEPKIIPFWYDIHDEVVPVLWDMCRAAVLGLVMLRPGIEEAEILRCLEPVLGAWDVGLMVGWLKDVGAVEEVVHGHGWRTTEWWWLALDENEDVTEIEGEGDGKEEEEEDEEMEPRIGEAIEGDGDEDEEDVEEDVGEENEEERMQEDGEREEEISTSDDDAEVMRMIVDDA